MNDKTRKINENLAEIELLKKSNLYCLKQIAKKPAKWEVKEYRAVIKGNLKEIRKLAEHNRVLGGFN